MAGLIRAAAAAAAAFAVFACATPAQTPQSAFWQQLQALCGRSYAGRLVTTDAADAAFASARLVIHVRDCSRDEVRVPFHVGEDHSRTWVITRTANGLRLKHDHRHEDGSEDRLSQYGGDTISEGAATRQEFPADAFSRALFAENNIPQSAANVWALEIFGGGMFAYELRRPNRRFRVEFDLTQPLAAPAHQTQRGQRDQFAGGDVATEVYVFHGPTDVLSEFANASRRCGYPAIEETRGSHLEPIVIMRIPRRPTAEFRCAWNWARQHRSGGLSYQ